MGAIDGLLARHRHHRPYPSLSFRAHRNRRRLARRSACHACARPATAARSPIGLSAGATSALQDGQPEARPVARAEPRPLPTAIRPSYRCRGTRGLKRDRYTASSQLPPLCAGASKTVAEEPGRVTLECGHKYHRRCLLSWCRQQRGNSSCPQCRAAVAVRGRSTPTAEAASSTEAL